MIKIQFAAGWSRWKEYKHVLSRELSRAGVSAELSQGHDPAEVDYIVYAPNPDLTDFSPFTRARAVLCLWAGVEDIVGNPTLTQPLTRMVDPGITEGMNQWVAGHVLRHHLGMDAHIVNPGHVWDPVSPPLSGDRTVGILGLGALGQAAGRILAGLGFNVIGWSRRQKEVEGIACHSGEDGLTHVLESAEILVLLLPLTQATENLINADRLARMRKGAVILNPGRGGLIDDSDLISALDDGRIAHATLDVFRTEPLPRDHRYWAHPKVTVTPHIASTTRAATAARVVAENIRRSEAGEDLLYIVDRSAGY